MQDVLGYENMIHMHAAAMHTAGTRKAGIRSQQLQSSTH